MQVEQIYTGCLAQGAYFIKSGNEAVIIDPLREIQPYLKKAKDENVTIRYIFETHFHADFVSGHIDLSKATGAPIVFGPGANPAFEAFIAKDQEILTVGEVKIKVLHTPGHTMESTTYLLYDEKGKEHAIFSGDTLFIGDVGRPDLAAKSDLTKEQLAGHLYDSLRNKIMVLPEDVIVYPAHGAGSACGKNMSKETFDTLGNQKRFNYALRADMCKEEFIKEVTDGLAPPPQYFPHNVRLNRDGYDAIGEVLSKGTRALSPEEFEVAANETGAVMLDTRKPADFVKGHIPNSIFIGIDGQFAPWVGTLITDIKQPLIIITEEGREEEVVTRLARVGYDNTLGYLKGGITSWLAAGKETQNIESISAEEFEKRHKSEGTTVIDVRRTGEYDSGHIENAKNLPLDFINENLSGFPKDSHFYIHCAGGYRSVIAASILKSRGWDNMTDVAGGYGAIKKTKIPMTEETCPSTQSTPGK